MHVLRCVYAKVFVALIIIIVKFISDKMSIETIKKKEKNPRTHTHTHTHNAISVNKTHSSYRHKT